MEFSLFVYMKRLAKSAVVLSIFLAPAVANAGIREYELNERELTTFLEELSTATNQPDRDSKVEALRKAAAKRPGHPYNIIFEFRVGIQLGQVTDRAHNQDVKPAEALAVFKGILEKYNHMDYYQKTIYDYGDDFGTPYGGISPQVIMPQAATQAAFSAIMLSNLGERDFDEALFTEARQYVHQAMEYLNQTYQARKEDLKTLKDPPPQKPPDWESPTEKAKWPGRMAAWRERQEERAAGKLFSDSEMRYTRIAVKHYKIGCKYPEQTIIRMNELIAEFPGTPIADFAQKEIEAAKERVMKKAAKLLEEIGGIEPPLDDDAPRKLPPQPPKKVQAPPPEPAPLAPAEPAAPTPPAAPTETETAKPSRIRRIGVVALAAALILAAAVVIFRKKRPQKPLNT